MVSVSWYVVLGMNCDARSSAVGGMVGFGDSPQVLVGAGSSEVVWIGG